MININIEAKYVRTTVYLMLFGGLLTTLSLTVFHTMQDDAFLIDDRLKLIRPVIGHGQQIRLSDFLATPNHLCY